ncbi:MAG TPA: glycosyltransferase [Candidatus Paceibacterota bacterium]
MKALFISNDPTIFEPGSSARERMRAYATAIGELHILSRGAKTADEQDGPLSLHSVRVASSPLGRVFAFPALSRLAQELIIEHGIEVVSAQDPFEYGYIAFRAVQGTAAKLHVQVHTDFCSPFFATESLKNRVRVRLADAVLHRAAGIRAVSERVKHGLLARYGERIPEPAVIPIVTVLSAPDASSTPDIPCTPPFPFVLMAIGRFEKEKRFADAVRAAAALVRAEYPVTLALVGEGREKESLRALAQKLGIAKHVVFLGWRTDTAALLSHAQAFIQTSAYEGYGRTYLEAALAGVPMVVTDAGIVGEVFKDNESALVCPVGDITCLTCEVTKLIEENDLRHRIGENAREAARAHLAALGDIPARIAADLARLGTNKLVL